MSYFIVFFFIFIFFSNKNKLPIFFSLKWYNYVLIAQRIKILFIFKVCNFIVDTLYFTGAFFNLIFKLIQISKKHVKTQKLITIYEKFFC